ncbi:hypothetical protein [Mycoplasmopsis canis]|uniref:hypothetical protein n=1 Tax=Mycoplasmopsis canis TaxID=29555 RepID=UPI000AFE20E4|nr:hypothetical protein [Mycoplasmopsis canis]
MMTEGLKNFLRKIHEKNERTKSVNIENDLTKLNSSGVRSKTRISNEYQKDKKI